jgi:hypothetical protein
VSRSWSIEQICQCNELVGIHVIDAEKEWILKAFDDVNAAASHALLQGMEAQVCIDSFPFALCIKCTNNRIKHKLQTHCKSFITLKHWMKNCTSLLLTLPIKLHKVLTFFLLMTQKKVPTKVICLYITNNICC